MGMIKILKHLLNVALLAGKVYDAVMRQKQTGVIPGIFGRLGDLGAIDPKYDVAVSTACGALDNYVVDTVDTAVACIEYLKKNDVGRANFMALEKTTHHARKLDGPFQVTTTSALL